MLCCDWAISIGYPLIGIIITGFCELNLIKLWNLFPAHKNFIVGREPGRDFHDSRWETHWSTLFPIAIDGSAGGGIPQSRQAIVQLGEPFRATHEMNAVFGTNPLVFAHLMVDEKIHYFMIENE
jgi:hypothetical protein